MGHPALNIPAREKGQDRPPIFVHSCIDDLDLSLEAFRVYSHLSRRWGDGTHDSVGSYSKIGEHCFRSSFPCASKATLKRKAIAAIKELEENGLIEKHKHQGYDGRDIANSYTLRTRDELSNTTLLQDNEWSQWSDRAIARQCQVTQPFVSKLRKQLSDNCYQMKQNHTRKVKRGEQVYEQRQRNPLKMKASQKQELSHPKKSVIPEIRPDVHEAICQFLNLEVEAQPNQYYQEDDRAYLIVSHDPEEMDLSLERLFSQLQGEKILNAIAVTPNQAGPQNQIKEKASAVCLISNSQCLCHRVVWYFGKQRHRFYSTFEPLGLAFLFGDEEVQV
ncbi:UNVERIFIED_CONTAM: hypothetical protein BEN50_09060 [Euhalothece sp. KZN 001]